VEFSIARDGADAVWRVRDHGIGIHPEDVRHLFQAFRRGRNVGARPGSGLGLVIVQRCVQLHGAEIHVESEPGQGTCVTVRLRVFAAIQPDAPESSAEPVDAEARTPRE